MVPEKSRPEWAELISGKIDPELSSFSLKMKVNSVRQLVKAGQLSLNDAIDDLYDLCIKYEKIYTEDINKVFKTKNVTL